MNLAIRVQKLLYAQNKRKSHKNWTQRKRQLNLCFSASGGERK